MQRTRLGQASPGEAEHFDCQPDAERDAGYVAFMYAYCRSWNTAVSGAVAVTARAVAVTTNLKWCYKYQYRYRVLKLKTLLAV